MGLLPILLGGKWFYSSRQLLLGDDKAKHERSHIFVVWSRHRTSVPMHLLRIIVVRMACLNYGKLASPAHSALI